MSESRTVTVGLDVHARSIRLAAICGDELLAERTLPYDEEALERVLRGWPRVRCCYEAGPTGFGLYRHLVERGFECEVVAPGLVPTRPGERVKTDSRDARKLARLLAGGLLQPIQVPSRELEAARDLVRAREAARLDRMRDRHRLSKFCLRHGRLLPGSSWTVARRRWLSEQRFPFAAEQLTFDTYLHAVDLVDARIEALERSIREAAEEDSWRQCAGCSSRPPGTRAADHESAASCTAVSAARTPSSSSAPGAASSACTRAGAGWPAAASPLRRSSSPAPESSPASSGRSRPSNRSEAPERTGSSSGCTHPHGEPSKHLCGTARW